MMKELVNTQVEEEMKIEEMLNELSGKLEMQIWEGGVELLKATFVSSIRGTSKYLVRQFSLCVEESYVFLDDRDDILSDNHPVVVSAFLVEDVTGVKLEDTNENFVGEICLKDGKILIERIED